MRAALWGTGAASAALFAAISFLMFRDVVPVAGKPLDMRIEGYGLADVYALNINLTEAARQSLLGPIRQLDTVFPIVLAVFLGLGVTALSRGMRLGVRLLLWGPAIAFALFDLLENARVAALLSLAPDALHVSAVRHAAHASALKFACLLIATALVATLAFRHRRIKDPR